MAEKILKPNAEHRSGTGQGKVKARAGCPCFSPQGYLNKASCSHSTVLKFHTIVSFSSESISSGDSLSVFTMRQNPGKTEIEAATWPLWRVRMAHNPEKVTHPLAKAVTGSSAFNYTIIPHRLFLRQSSFL